MFVFSYNNVIIKEIVHIFEIILDISKRCFRDKHK